MLQADWPVMSAVCELLYILDYIHAHVRFTQYIGGMEGNKYVTTVEVIPCPAS
jgi:hypothetical protein